MPFFCPAHVPILQIVTANDLLMNSVLQLATFCFFALVSSSFEFSLHSLLSLLADVTDTPIDPLLQLSVPFVAIPLYYVRLGSVAT